MQRIGWKSALALVVANMVGTGVFTTLGMQLELVQNTWTVLSLWLIGGGIAFLGAYIYAELGTHWPASGGEYHYLSRTYRPLIGYLSGWVSMTVGFSASIALSAMAMGAYLTRFLMLTSDQIAVLAVLVLSAVHSSSLRRSSRFQVAVTGLKVLFILGLIIAGVLVAGETSSFDWSAGWKQEVLRPAYAVALVFVTYAYSGWNAAAYITGEIREPRKNLPRALLGGTLVVTLLFVALQYVFLKRVPIELLRGKVEVGQVAADYVLGAEAGRWVSIGVSLLLVSSISAMVWVGPRIIRALAADYPIWHFLRQENRHGIPVRAIWFQCVISLLLILTGTFGQVLLYSGFVLQLFSALAVTTSWRLRREGPPRGLRTPLFPLLQVLYLVISAWIMIYMLVDQPWQSAKGLILVAVGGATYLLNGSKSSASRCPN